MTGKTFGRGTHGKFSRCLWPARLAFGSGFLGGGFRFGFGFGFHLSPGVGFFRFGVKHDLWGGGCVFRFRDGCGGRHGGLPWCGIPGDTVAFGWLHALRVERSDPTVKAEHSHPW